MFGGQTRVPLVVRQPIGMWRSSAAQHSQSLEAWYAHIPGLVVICPATPEDNKGLLKSAIRCDDPVVYMEHKLLWPLEGEVPAGDDRLVPIGKARVARPGRDLTLVTWSATVHVALQAAAQLEQSGIEVEVIDLRTLWPWDKAAVLESVERTGRLLVAHEAVSVAGFGAEVVATVCEALMERLLAPPVRVAAPRIHIGYAPTLEDQVRVTPQRLVEAATRLAKLRPGRTR
jgi:pyruvate dehydrogenase E1 component beta subunit